MLNFVLWCIRSSQEERIRVGLSNWGCNHAVGGSLGLNGVGFVGEKRGKI